jgi:glycosyltransferase involved in cell wall biosynthesis
VREPSGLRILHLVGATGDHGGILSVIRALQAATPATCRHAVLVNSAFVQNRTPRLELLAQPHILDEAKGHVRLLLRNLRAWPALRRLLEENRFDVVHAHSRGSLPLALLLAQSRPLLFTNHAYARRIGLYRFAARHLRSVVLTPAMLHHYGLSQQTGRVEVISACCADAWFATPLPDAPPKTHEHATVRLTGVGNLVRWKKWDLVLRALAQLPAEARSRIRFQIWGPVPNDPDARAFSGELSRMLDELQLRQIVSLAGATADVPAVLADTDVFILPSTNEPCSVALIEALAAGLPVVASRSGGNVDIVREGETGLLFTPDNVDALTGCLRRILDGSFSPAAPAAIRESVRQRSATVVGAEYLRIYRELAAAR